MVTFSPRAVIPTRRLPSLLVLGLLLWQPPLQADEQPQLSETQAAEAFKPYEAAYKTTTRGMSITLNRQLKRGKNQEWILTNGGKMLVAGFQETSVFTVDGDRIKPRSWIYQGSGLINRRREVHFTEGSDIIRSLYKDVWYELPYSEGTLDRVSQQEQLRLFLLNDPTPKEDVTFRVADGKRIKDYVLKYVAEEELETELGTVNTLHFERLHDDDDRKSDLWVAPAWDFMMVKTVHIEDGSPTEATIISAAIDGEPVQSP